MTEHADISALMPTEGWIKRYVDYQVSMKEAPAAAHFGSALCLLSAAIGWKMHISWGPGAEEPMNLFVLLEGPSGGAHKTTTMNAAKGIARAAVEGIAVEPGLFGGPALQIKSSSHASKPGLLNEVGTSDPEVAEAYESAILPPGIMLTWDEFGAVLGRPGDTKGSDYKGELRAALMELYGGRFGGSNTNTLKMPPQRISVSILATMTRHELEERMSTGLLKDGFLGRFLLIPHPKRSKFISEPDEQIIREQQGTLAGLVDDLRDIVAWDTSIGSAFKLQTEDAREVRREWYERRSQELQDAADGGSELDEALESAMSRLQTTQIKVAAIMAVSERPSGLPLDQVRISADNAKAGIAFVELLLSEIRSLADTNTGNIKDAYAKKVIKYLEKQGKEITRSKLMNGISTPLDNGQCWKVVETLHEENLVTIRVPEKGRGCFVSIGGG